MTSGLGRVGPRGLALLAVAGLAGVLLAVHGWSARGSSAALGSIGGSASAGAPPPPASPTLAAPSHTAGPTARPAARPSPSSGPSVTTPGPLLSSQSYASYSFQVWPGARTQAAQAALTGLSVTVHRQATGISVTAGVNGQAASPPHYYALGARLYVLEASLGDDSGNSDYNLGDDGIVVTDAHGRILQ